ncbi:RNA polymerase 2 mediator complex component [Grosmannia clavigera kw1407]|uniref:RNA polymerase 2 mediator complex component n=1 Tax=Grosmannia clavigera (strain kw1407 / UAMH 11150) TaxID=655863 RepID=F0XE19_GROCL|nr:RNA polymerase 2 mediator complex component [Grosmannia clavigera kw1407]EFX03463.1 RNA polymerase 2 mediator complex component [Grosmannia clavigera kw1407]
MSGMAERNACRACARSKRRCGKERPACHRCQDRHQDCEYPPAKLCGFVAVEEAFGEQSVPEQGSLLGDDGNHNIMLGDFLNMPLSVSADKFLQLRLALGATGLPLLSSQLEQSPQPSLPSLTSLPSLYLPQSPTIPPRWPVLWFLAPETWKIDRRPEPIPSAYDMEPIRGHIVKIQQWLMRWVATGSCPFIHPYLYRVQQPGCVQVAFTTLTSYVYRTEVTADMVLQIVEDQASHLLSDNGVALADGGVYHVNESASGFSPTATPRTTSSSSAPPTAADAAAPGLLEQLARTHALVVYQTISLFDGDIRARHLAEGRQAVLSRWAGQLIESARLSLGVAWLQSDGLLTAVEQHPWYLWILSESIRRAWMVASAIEAIYGILQRGWYPCPGNIMCTTRQAIWNARSAADWEQCCAETADRPGQLAHRQDFERFFAESSAADIDEFIRALMASTFGDDRVRRWESDSEGVAVD